MRFIYLHSKHTQARAPLTTTDHHLSHLHKDMIRAWNGFKRKKRKNGRKLVIAEIYWLKLSTGRNKRHVHFIARHRLTQFRSELPTCRRRHRVSCFCPSKSWLWVSFAVFISCRLHCIIRDRKPYRTFFLFALFPSSFFITISSGRLLADWQGKSYTHLIKKKKHKLFPFKLRFSPSAVPSIFNFHYIDTAQTCRCCHCCCRCMTFYWCIAWTPNCCDLRYYSFFFVPNSRCGKAFPN